MQCLFCTKKYWGNIWNRFSFALSLEALSLLTYFLHVHFKTNLLLEKKQSFQFNMFLVPFNCNFGGYNYKVINYFPFQYYKEGRNIYKSFYATLYFCMIQEFFHMHDSKNKVLWKRARFYHFTFNNGVDSNVWTRCFF